jgi:CheY-like chemotaxis protein
MVTLPVSQARIQQGDQAPSCEEHHLRVVLVEDEADIRQSMQTLLELLGHEVQTAPDGEAGFDLICQTQPQVALLDLGLPGVDGLELARRVKATLVAQSPYLVAVTGYGQDSDRHRARDAGFDDHLVKPASADDLRRALERAASRLVEPTP